jgi:hypothetical protein
MIFFSLWLLCLCGEEVHCGAFGPGSASAPLSICDGRRAGLLTSCPNGNVQAVREKPGEDQNGADDQAVHPENFLVIAAEDGKAQ